LSKSFLSPFMM